MEIALKDRFLAGWQKYFPGAELPIVFYYTDKADRAQPAVLTLETRCIICALKPVREGQALRFDEDNIGCGGGKRYLGFQQELRPTFRYFLSCGIPGELEGERYKKTPELVDAHLQHHPTFEAPGKYIVFKRWDRLDEKDEPTVVIFFASSDVLSGLYTLAGFDEADLQAVIAPFGSGCASIVDYPFHELGSARPRAVLGMFDVSARPCVPGNVLTLAIPWPKFVRMVDDMEESFLITSSWARVRERLVD